MCKTLRGDQNLQILCLSETRSIPLNFIWESPSGVVPSSGGWSGSSSISIVLHAAGTGEAREEDIGLFFIVCICVSPYHEKIYTDYEMKTRENPVNIFMVFFNKQDA